MTPTTRGWAARTAPTPTHRLGNGALAESMTSPPTQTQIWSSPDHKTVKLRLCVPPCLDTHHNSPAPTPTPTSSQPVHLLLGHGPSPDPIIITQPSHTHPLPRSLFTSFWAMVPFAEHWFAMADFAPDFMVSTVLAVSIDYTLFFLSRYREEVLVNKRSNEDAVRVMVSTSGVTVLLSGLTLAITYLGLTFFPVNVILTHLHRPTPVSITSSPGPVDVNTASDYTHPFSLTSPAGLTFFPVDVILTLGLGAGLALCTSIVVNETLTPALLLVFGRFFADFRMWGFYIPWLCRGCCNDGRTWCCPDGVHVRGCLRRRRDEEPTAGTAPDPSVETSPLLSDRPAGTSPPSETDDDPELTHFDTSGWGYRFAKVITTKPGAIVVLLIVTAASVPLLLQALSIRITVRMCGYHPPVSVYITSPSGSRVYITSPSGSRSACVDITPECIYHLSIRITLENNQTIPPLACTFLTHRRRTHLPSLDNNQIIPQTPAFLLFQEMARLFPAGLIAPYRTSILSVVAVEGFNVSVELAQACFDPTSGIYDEHLCQLYRSEWKQLVNTRETAILVQISLPFDPWGDLVEPWVMSVRAVFRRYENTTNGAILFYMDGGITEQIDVVDEIYGLIPMMIIFTIGGAFVMVTLYFRSAVVALRLVISIGIVLTQIYGLAVLVFQRHILIWIVPYLSQFQSILWVTPVLTFPILVGLGMDYDIFLTTRIYEYRRHPSGLIDNREAVCRAVSKTGGVITTAGMIMGLAFGGLMMSSTMFLAEAGMMLSLAVLILDAMGNDIHHNVVFLGKQDSGKSEVIRALQYAMLGQLPPLDRVHSTDRWLSISEFQIPGSRFHYSFCDTNGARNEFGNVLSVLSSADLAIFTISALDSDQDLRMGSYIRNTMLSSFVMGCRAAIVLLTFLDSLPEREQVQAYRRFCELDVCAGSFSSQLIFRLFSKYKTQLTKYGYPRTHYHFVPFSPTRFEAFLTTPAGRVALAQGLAEPETIPGKPGLIRLSPPVMNAFMQHEYPWLAREAAEIFGSAKSSHPHANATPFPAHLSTPGTVHPYLSSPPPPVHMQRPLPASPLESLESLTCLIASVKPDATPTQFQRCRMRADQQPLRMPILKVYGQVAHRPTTCDGLVGPAVEPDLPPVIGAATGASSTGVPATDVSSTGVTTTASSPGATATIASSTGVPATTSPQPMVLCGCVHTGILWEGALLHIPGVSSSVRVVSLRSFGRPAAFARPGDFVSVGVMLVNDGPSRPGTGCVLCDHEQTSVGHMSIPAGTVAARPERDAVPTAGLGHPLMPIPDRAVTHFKAQTVVTFGWHRACARMTMSVHTCTVEVELVGFQMRMKKTMQAEPYRRGLRPGDTCVAWFRVAPQFNAGAVAKRARGRRCLPKKPLMNPKAATALWAPMDSGAPRLARFILRHESNSIVAAGMVLDVEVDPARGEARMQEELASWGYDPDQWRRIHPQNGHYRYM
ncbi:putative Membrane protein YdfJ [Paratrimastix pyriformis]|uniref:Membrane protein YdfJ n=1 Tax=Paratrimastix pyriformis TaxID=342808 RepID=A0ABQ8UNB8_9EUKA|nr:putative Membrane protein YdfJ [Paratrimastix pyriformis]